MTHMFYVPVLNGIFKKKKPQFSPYPNIKVDECVYDW